MLFVASRTCCIEKCSLQGGTPPDLEPRGILFSKNVQLIMMNWPNLHCRVGTRLYSAPEQLNSNVYDSKADIFALGQLLIHVEVTLLSLIS